jgi:hypothetical protein
MGQGHAAFEVDNFDRASQSGWSVLVTGRIVRHEQTDS